MAYPAELFHFGKKKHIGDMLPDGHLSFGLAAGFVRTGLTSGQNDDEMKRTAKPSPKTTSILVGDTAQTAQPLKNLTAINVGFGIRVPYFMKCFSLGHSEEMYVEVEGDCCIEVLDVPEFFRRFEEALKAQLPTWGALTAHAQYWDFSRIPYGMTQPDLMFLKDAAKYSCQKEYRIVLLPPEGFVVTGSDMRQSIRLGSLSDIAKEIAKATP
ncbi:MAG: hypothetical protein RL077_61 [Verrucomicrobiota bacterium]|jgi:hypothetical protein